MNAQAAGAISLLPLGLLPGVSDAMSAPRQALFSALGSSDGSGSQLLQSLFGIDPESTAGSWGGTAAEVLGDPLNLVMGGAAGLAGKGIAKLGSMGKLAELAALEEQGRGLATLGRGVTQGARHPLMMEQPTEQAFLKMARNQLPTAMGRGDNAVLLGEATAGRGLPSDELGEARSWLDRLLPAEEAGKREPPRYLDADLRYFRDKTSRAAKAEGLPLGGDTKGRFDASGSPMPMGGAAANPRFPNPMGSFDPLRMLTPDEHVLQGIQAAPPMANPLNGRGGEILRAADLTELRRGILENNSAHNSAAFDSFLDRTPKYEAEKVLKPKTYGTNSAGSPMANLTADEQMRAAIAARSSPAFQGIDVSDRFPRFQPNDPLSMGGNEVGLRLPEAIAVNQNARGRALAQSQQLSPLLQQLMLAGSGGSLGGAAGLRLANQG